jgi:hypothetical protein
MGPPLGTQMYRPHRNVATKSGRDTHPTTANESDCGNGMMYRKRVTDASTMTIMHRSPISPLKYVIMLAKKISAIPKSDTEITPREIETDRLAPRVDSAIAVPKKTTAAHVACFLILSSSVYEI